MSLRNISYLFFNEIFCLAFARPANNGGNNKPAINEMFQAKQD